MADEPVVRLNLSIVEPNANVAAAVTPITGALLSARDAVVDRMGAGPSAAGASRDAWYLRPEHSAKIMGQLPDYDPEEPVDVWATAFTTKATIMGLPEEFWPRWAMSKLPGSMVVWVKSVHPGVLDVARTGETTWANFTETLEKGNAKTVSQTEIRTRLRELTVRPGHVKEFTSKFHKIASSYTDEKYAVGGVEGCNIILQQLNLEVTYVHMYAAVVQHRSAGEWDDWRELLEFMLGRDLQLCKVPGPHKRSASSYAAVVSGKRGREREHERGRSPVRGEKRERRDHRSEKRERRDVREKRDEVPWYKRGKLTEEVKKFLRDNNGCYFCRAINLKDPSSHQPCPEKEDKPDGKSSSRKH